MKTWQDLTTKYIAALEDLQLTGKQATHEKLQELMTYVESPAFVETMNVDATDARLKAYHQLVSLIVDLAVPMTTTVTCPYCHRVLEFDHPAPDGKYWCGSCARWWLEKQK